MAVRVYIPALSLLRRPPRLAEAEIFEGSGHTVREVLMDIRQRYPDVERRVFGAYDTLRPFFRVKMNETEIRDLGMPVPDGAEIHLTANIHRW